MVIKKRAAALAFALTLAGGFSAAPAVRAQSVLEQMENEVANIAAKTKSAVVTISESGNYATRIEVAPETSEQAKKRVAAAAAAIKNLSAAYANLDHAETAARVKRKKLLETYGESAMPIQEQNGKIAALKKSMADTLAELNAWKAGAGNAPQAEKYYVFRGTGVPEQSSGMKTGSGFSIGDGYIVTTADVLDGMANPLVTTDGGTQVRAQIMGVNKEWNIGLLKLLAKVNLPALKLGNSAKVAVGHFAISVGQQSGQANSVALLLVGGLRTDGVSAGGHFYPELIQIAGTVGEGISGAPLVNSRGEVIGIMAGVPAAPLSPLGITAAPGNTAGIEWNDGLKALGVRQYGQTQNSDPQYYLHYAIPDAPAPESSPFVLLPQSGSSKSATPVIPPEGTEKANDSAILPPKTVPGEHLDALPQKTAPVQKSVPVLGDLPYIGTLFRSNALPNAPVTNWNLSTAVPASAAPVTSAGFAVPINSLKPILDELKSGKPVAKGWIGISPRDDVTTSETGGVVTEIRRVVVEGVYPDSPAFAAGILPGDEIVSLNGKSIQSANDVREVSQNLRVGDKLRIGRRAFVGAKRNQTDVELRITERPAVYKTPLVLQKEKAGAGD